MFLIKQYFLSQSSAIFLRSYLFFYSVNRRIIPPFDINVDNSIPVRYRNLVDITTIWRKPWTGLNAK